jgi:hypothetical protein
MSKIIIILFCFFIISCGKKENIFKEEVIIVEKPLQADTLIGNLLKIDGIYTGYVGAYDSLIFFGSHKYADYFIYVFNNKTGQQLSSIMKMGEGPDEFIVDIIGSADQIEIEDSICTWFFDDRRKKCVLITWLDGTIKKEINISALRSGLEYPLKYFILNDSVLIAYNQGEAIFTDNTGSMDDYFTPPKYHVFNYKNGRRIITYEPYNKFKYNEITDPQGCLFSWDNIKPDKTKLVMGMLYLGQINIMDIATGKITGYYIQDTPDFDVLRKYSDFNGEFFYSLIFVDDDFIYGAINEREDGIMNNNGYGTGVRKGNGKTTLYVFDWNGNFKKIIVLDKEQESIALDPVNKHIYVLTNGEDDEEVYRYDVKYLYAK